MTQVRRAPSHSLLRRAALMPAFGALVLTVAGCASHVAQTPSLPNDLRFSAHAVIEAAPVHYALKYLQAGQQQVPNGGIAALYRNLPAGEADLAGHADTQALRHSLDHPDLRIILTVTEGHYRIVTKRSTGIRSVADLRGRKVATVNDSSAAFYLQRALEMAGMRESDIETVALPLPPRDSAQLLLDGRADALVLWDPEPEIAIEQLGEDAIILDPNSGYQELYNLHTTAVKLADPIFREKIIGFVAKLITASKEMRDKPVEAQELTAEIAGYPKKLIAASWPQHHFPAALSPNLLDTLEAEESWLAEKDGRKARTREQLATLIDPTIEAEALARMSRK